MDLDIFKKSLKSIFGEILVGSSPLGGYFVKHLGIKDAGELEIQERKFYERAELSGIQTNKAKLEQLVQEKAYDPKDEVKIDNLKLSLIGLRITKSKVFLSHELKRIDVQIKQTEQEVRDLEQKKANLMGLTCETYASRRMNEFYIYYTLYKDDLCLIKAFNFEEFENIDEEDLNGLINQYCNFSDKFSDHNLKRIAVNNFFLNYFCLSDEDPYGFYGKAVSNLSFYQMQLFGVARYFRHLMTESTIKHPEEYGDDVDRIIDWYTSGNNLEKLTEEKKQKEGKESALIATSVMGASKEDFKKIQEMKNAGAIDLGEAAQKKGGMLTMEDLMKLHGLK